MWNHVAVLHVMALKLILSATADLTLDSSAFVKLHLEHGKPCMTLFV